MFKFNFRWQKYVCPLPSSLTSIIPKRQRDIVRTHSRQKKDLHASVSSYSETVMSGKITRVSKLMKNSHCMCCSLAPSPSVVYSNHHHLLLDALDAALVDGSQDIFFLLFCSACFISHSHCSTMRCVILKGCVGYPNQMCNERAA